MFRQPVEGAAPEARMEIEPFARLGEGVRLELAAPVLAFPQVLDQRGFFQHLQVAGDCGQGDIEWLGEFAHRRVAGGEPREDGPAGGVGEGGEGLIEWCHLTYLLINVSVKSRDAFRRVGHAEIRSLFVLDSVRTRVEHHSPTRTEAEMIWAKDIMAGAGLLAFVACSFALATMAQAFVGA